MRSMNAYQVISDRTLFLQQAHTFCFAILVFTILSPEARVRNNKNPAHNCSSLGLCSLLNVDAVASPFFQYVNCSTKNKSTYIRKKHVVRWSLRQTQTQYIDSVKEIEKNEVG